jgi:hypothetical protein
MAAAWLLAAKWLACGAGGGVKAIETKASGNVAWRLS